MNIINDSNCIWLNQLENRKKVIELKEDIKCDYLIVGAGYTGLSAARKLSEIHSNKNIIIVIGKINLDCSTNLKILLYILDFLK